MLSFTVFTAVSLSLVAAFIVPRATQPDNWSPTLESWNAYHARYLALGCDENHSTSFFAKCCHPLQANQNNASLPSQCTSGNNIVDNGNDDDNGDDCDDDGDETTQVPSHTSTKPSASTATVSSSHDDGDNSDDCDDDGDETTQVPLSTSTKPDASTAAATPTRRILIAPSPSTHNTATTTPTTPPSIQSTATPKTGGFITYYLQNGVAGACGTVHNDSALICALQTDLYGKQPKSEFCGKQIEIHANNSTVTVTVADECPTCDNSNSIDLSQAAFLEIAPLSVGILPATWRFLD